ncbi:unnamed protein product [Euphydryas editha]|uniref:Uncharacterized protein n=1 Tax=Euphydryas editha TaxID=104508 RepID=A0AAU9VA17_EUPED|nr:unnamed protein product [Euphydryas editha]
MVLRKVVFTHLMLLVTPKEKFDPRAYMRWQNHISQQSLRQPKALQQLCLHAMNKSLIQNDSARPVQNINQVNYLIQIAHQPENTNNKIAMKLKHVAKVITKTFLEKQKEIEKSKANEKEVSKKTQQIKRTQTQSKGADPAQLGPSGIAKKEG